MRKRNDQDPKEDTIYSATKLNNGELLTDITGKQWKLGKTIGVGGFGEIYLVSDNLKREVKADTSYVAKIESHMNGPLFVEMNCYIRMAKLSMIENWKESRKISSLGMPHYVAFGSHIHNGERFRFLILPRFDKDLEKILEAKQILNPKSVLTIASQIIDVLEYIHSNGYIHSDIKASNILLNNFNKVKQTKVVTRQIHHPMRSCRMRIRSGFSTTKRNLRANKSIFYLDDVPNFDYIMQDEQPILVQETNIVKQDQVYLLDYGLAAKFLTASGNHKPFAIDQRKAHAGTLIFCSCDAHLGVSSRRSDLESLGYNMIYWLTGILPWSKDVEDPDLVAKQKRKAFDNVELFLTTCFSGTYPEFLLDYFNYLQTLRFQQKPDYAFCKNLFENTIIRQGFKNDNLFDFDKEQRWKPTQKKIKSKLNENKKIPMFIHRISRPPLISNVPNEPLLRKKIKQKDIKQLMKWSQILQDPENIIKQNKKKNVVDENQIVPNILEMDIKAMNPTYAMLDVYNKCKERPYSSPTYKGDNGIENVEGYTPAMLSVLSDIRKRKEYELEQMAVNCTNTKNSKGCNRRGRKRRNNESPTKVSLLKAAKSVTVLKKENIPYRKLKNLPLTRTYSLRG